MSESLGFLGKEVNLLVKKGATCGPFVITVQNPDGTPMDLAGYTARAQIRKAVDAVDPPAATFTASVSSPAAGELTLSIAKSVTANLASGPTEHHPDSQYVWDCEIEAVDGSVIAIAFGAVRVKPEVTR